MDICIPRMFISDIKEMTRKEYNDFRGWIVPEDENPEDKGVMVTVRATKHTNWYPKEVFDKLYIMHPSMNFGMAIDALKAGHKVARKGWNGKKMFLFLVPGSNFKVNRPPLLGIYPEGTEIVYCPHIDMKTADGSIVPWLASQTDVLAEDWELVFDTDVKE